MKTFESPTGVTVLVEMVDGEPWFAANDVAKCVGLTNPPLSIRKVCSYDKKVLLVGKQAKTFISAYGLFEVLGKSMNHYEKQKSFVHWITSTVFPALYNPEKPSVPTTLQGVLRAYADELDANERNKADTLDALKKIAEIAGSILTPATKPESEPEPEPVAVPKLPNTILSVECA